jgi:four helix bundle protein
VSRKHQTLRVFVLADELVVQAYEVTRDFPVEERYGLCSQIRRAAVSVPTNIVEGCTRASRRDFLQFLRVSLGSSSEVEYLLNLSVRLSILPDEKAGHLLRRYNELTRGLQSFIQATENLES